ncbi:MAG TPA: LysR family transcriptional regulator [Bradyrhizobium sp.]|nr:LysR family transcriptional regulator [Bradyrhizobium sp.]
MTNIPTELLRTLVAVVDLRSFTRAAQSLGVTQPAVSAQIKRLQGLLGTELLDKSAPGVALTSAGELVVNYARRLLSINDQILDFAAPRATSQTLRIGATGDFTATNISHGLACFRARHAHLRFIVHSASIDDLLRNLREGDVDVVVWVSPTGPTFEARHCWTEELVWVRGAAMQFDDAAPVPLVGYGEDCPFTHSMIATLNSVGRDSDLVFKGSSIAGISAAVTAGIGVSALPRNSANLPGAVIWEDAPLPKLPDFFCGIYVRAGGESDDRDHLADTMATALRLRRHVGGEVQRIEPAKVTSVG